MAGPPAPFRAGEGLAIRGEAAGEGTPVVLCHGLTATRHSVLHGSRALERAGHQVVTYDARGHGESGPAPAGRGYGYSELVGDLESVLAARGGGERFLLGGSSMGAHTALAYALQRPERLAGLVAIGPSYESPLGPEGLARWDGLALALEEGGVEGFVAEIDRGQPLEPRWRGSVLRFTRERMRHRDLAAVADALREVPRSAPFADLEELEAIEVPVLLVASRDEADPGHPYAVAAAYAERLPRAELVVESEGHSPLAWRGGRLSRAIAEFAARL